MTNREDTHARAKALIEGAGTHFISVEFFKKDGTLRKMNVHPTAIEHRLVGVAASESAKKGIETRRVNHPEIYPVVDVRACKAGEPKAIRSINLDTLVSITVDGTRHDFDPVTL
jgi:hypothetical protein